MRRYSFIYSGSNKRITELIEYLEEVYKLKFLDVIDLAPNFSFNPPLISFSQSSKEIMFETNEEFEKIRKCKFCNFPISSKDLELYKNNLEACKNCGRPCKENGEYFR